METNNAKSFIMSNIVYAEPCVKNGRSGYTVEYSNGYETWYPVDFFKYYAIKSDGFLSFSNIIEVIKYGNKCTRRGLNGAYIYYVGENKYEAFTDIGKEIANKYVDGKVSYKPYIAIVCNDGLVMPWTPTQEDILANDWIITK